MSSKHVSIYRKSLSSIVSQQLSRIMWVALVLMLSTFALDCAAQTPGVYNLVSKTSGLDLDNEGSYTAAHDVYQWSGGAGNTNQQWQLNQLSNGRYNLISLSSGMALDNGGSNTAGASFLQNVSSTTNTNQQFTITNLGNGYYQLVVASSGMALDNSGATTNGGAVHQWSIESGNSNQEWELIPVNIGAVTPFSTYEAESGTLAGGATVVSLTSPATTEFSSPQLEASGHAYVHLSGTGQSVTWTNNTGGNLTFLNVRYSIPDSSGGGGITSTLDLYVNGTFRQAIPVNSQHTWMYETSSTYGGNAESPADGNPYDFWDEAPVTISGAFITPGQTIMLKKDGANSVSYYNIDVIDLENPPAPYTQPANSLSLTTDCGAVANNPSHDNLSAIQTCFSNAASQKKSVWIPQGTFYVNSQSSLTPTGITIQGAGMWYSTIYYNPTLPATSSTHGVIEPTSCTLENFAVDSSSTGKSLAGADVTGVNAKGSNWLIQGLWVRHVGPAIWADGTNGLIQNNRINNSWSDGININNGNGGSGNNTGDNMTVKNNFVRGTGDDGYALNQGFGTGYVAMIGNTLINNTSVGPWRGNNFGIYGGTNSLIANNLAHDAVRQYGFSVGLFGGTGQLGATKVQGNVTLRPGGLAYGQQHAGFGVGVSVPAPGDGTGVVIQGNTITDAMFNGMQIYTGQSMIISNNTVNAPGNTGFIIDSTALGSAALTCNTAGSIKSGQSAYIDNASTSNFTVTGSCNNGFTVP
jgi:hypothetical protein